MPITPRQIAAVTAKAGFRSFRPDELQAAADWLGHPSISPIMTLANVASAAGLLAQGFPPPPLAQQALGALTWSTGRQPIPAWVFDEIGRARAALASEREAA